MPRTYFVYILASESRELYIGVTNDLARRLAQHRERLNPVGYTAKRQTTRLVYAETTDDVRAAIGREKQIKGWTRRRKLDLIEKINPDWKDLALGWCIPSFRPLRFAQGDNLQAPVAKPALSDQLA